MSWVLGSQETREARRQKYWPSQHGDGDEGQALLTANQEPGWSRLGNRGSGWSQFHQGVLWMRGAEKRGDA